MVPPCHQGGRRGRQWEVWSPVGRPARPLSLWSPRYLIVWVGNRWWPLFVLSCRGQRGICVRRSAHPVAGVRIEDGTRRPSSWRRPRSLRSAHRRRLPHPSHLPSLLTSPSAGTFLTEEGGGRGRNEGPTVCPPADSGWTLITQNPRATPSRRPFCAFPGREGGQ